MAFSATFAAFWWHNSYGLVGSRPLWKVSWGSKEGSWASSSSLKWQMGHPIVLRLIFRIQLHLAHSLDGRCFQELKSLVHALLSAHKYWWWKLYHAQRPRAGAERRRGKYTFSFMDFKWRPMKQLCVALDDSISNQTAVLLINKTSVWRFHCQ